MVIGFGELCHRSERRYQKRQATLQIDSKIELTLFLIILGFMRN